jgi:hypothetical protein
LLHRVAVRAGELQSRWTSETMASPLFPLLESFYERFEPRGVAFVGSAKFGASFGRSPTSILPRLESAVGFTQLHLEDESVSIYASYFGWGVLVAQFGFQEDYPPPSRPWLAFVRLAAHIQLYLDNPDSSEPPAVGVLVRSPHPGPPHVLRAEASPEKS